MMYLRLLILCFFFFKQKTAYEMRISDWSSDVCSSDLLDLHLRPSEAGTRTPDVQSDAHGDSPSLPICSTIVLDGSRRNEPILAPSEQIILARPPGGIVEPQPEIGRAHV